MNDASEFWQAVRDYNKEKSMYNYGLGLVEIWGKSSCPYCKRAKQMSKKHGLNYVYHQLDEDFTREEFLEKFPDAKTYPQITVAGDYVGGYTEFRNMLKG
jgi:glutaredoxin